MFNPIHHIQPTTAQCMIVDLYGTYCTVYSTSFLSHFCGNVRASEALVSANQLLAS
jgi:hypothetical protein